MPKVANLAELNKERIVVPYAPTYNYRQIGDFVFKRVEELKKYRKQLKIEQEWKEADVEYVPAPLSPTTANYRLESDDELGLRSRLVPVGDSAQEWRSDNADPTLLVKIQTALSIIIDATIDATFRPTQKRYKASTEVAKALWKRNQEITNAREVYKKIAFNLFKYGWAPGRTYPRDVRYPKRIMTEYNKDDPDESVFQDAVNVLFSDVFREDLDPFRTWIDPAARPYDPLSRNECYFEVDYGEDQFEMEFSQYKYANAVNPSPTVPTSDESAGEVRDQKENRKQVTVGFYENRAKDIYGIVVPEQKIVLYYSPLPNDDGLLSVWDAPLILRNTQSPYGVSLWRIIKQDKELYDKMKNMTMDQLVISIMKMGFVKGAASMGGDNVIQIVPGKFKDLPAGADVNWLEVPGPGKEAWEGLRALKAIIDDNSGITPTLSGEVTQGKTLGEILHAKESALKRLRTPIENLAYAIEQDAYLMLSWGAQIYSTPEVREFVEPGDIAAYERETGTRRNELFATGMDEMTGQPTGFKATFLPELNLKLEKRGDKFFETKDERFFQVGKDLEPSLLKWKGIIKVIPRSIVSPSVEVEKQRRLEIFNILAPLLLNPPELFAKAAEKVLESNDEKAEDWLPDTWVQFLRGEQQPPLFVQDPMMMAQGQMAGGSTPSAGPGGRFPQGFESMQGMSGVKPNQGAPTVLPQEQVGGQRAGHLAESVGNTFGR